VVGRFGKADFKYFPRRIPKKTPKELAIISVMEKNRPGTRFCATSNPTPSGNIRRAEIMAVLKL
jgi:hypothetical protein